MNPTVNPAKTCPRRQTLLPSGTLSGLCPACLLDWNAADERFQRALLHDEIAQTLADPAGVDEELRSLRAALAP